MINVKKTMRILLICAFILTGKLQIETKSSDTDVISDSILHLQSRVVKNETMLRIFGGEEVKPHSYPFQALLIIHHAELRHKCGGSLISPRLVLTGAHCFGDDDGSEITPVVIYLGLHHIGDMKDAMTQMFSSVNYKLHPAYKYQVHGLNIAVVNDIALVILPEEAVLNDFVRPVTVATGPEDYAGESATILGWGRTDDEDAISQTLHSVTAEVLTNEACREIYFSLHVTISERQLCVSRAGGKGGCKWDYGGPLVVNGVQIGLMSFGPNNCSATEVPTVFTRLNRYKDWIREIENSAALTVGIRNAFFGLAFVILALE